MYTNARWTNESTLDLLDAGIREVIAVYNAVYRNVSGNTLIRPQHWHGRTLTIVTHRLNVQEARLAHAQAITYPAPKLASATKAEADFIRALIAA